MKIGILLILVCLVACNKKSKSTPVAASPLVAVDSAQGTWEICVDLDEANDFKLTQVISGSSFEYTEVYYLSDNGTCQSTKLFTVTASGTLTKGSGDVNPMWPDSIPVDFTFSGPKQVKAVDAAYLDVVDDCTDETSPAAGVFYNVTKEACGFQTITGHPVTAGTVIYSFAQVVPGTPNTLTIGNIDNDHDGLTLAKRFTFAFGFNFNKI